MPGSGGMRQVWPRGDMIQVPALWPVVISATFLIDSISVDSPFSSSSMSWKVIFTSSHLLNVCRSKVKTVHERIPLAGLSKLPSVPQIAKVKAGTKRRWLPLLGWVLGVQACPGWALPLGKRSHCSLGPLTACMGWGSCWWTPPNPYSISSSLLKLLRKQAALIPGSYPKFAASSGDQRNGGTGLDTESRVGL